MVSVLALPQRVRDNLLILAPREMLTLHAHEHLQGDHAGALGLLAPATIDRHNPNRDWTQGARAAASRPAASGPAPAPNTPSKLETSDFSPFPAPDDGTYHAYLLLLSQSSFNIASPFPVVTVRRGWTLTAPLVPHVCPSCDLVAYLLRRQAHQRERVL